MKVNNKKGIALITALFVISVLVVLAVVTTFRSVSENFLSRRQSNSVKAFWLAEAGINKALRELRSNYSLTAIGPVQLGEGGFSVSIEDTGVDRKKVVSRGFLPFSGALKSEYFIESVMLKYVTTPDHFFDNAIYCASNVILNGNSYDVDGSVRYAGSISSNTANIDGDIFHDPSINPLARFNFDQLRQISMDQGNYHDVGQLNGPFPTSFWYNEAAGIPNVIFLEGSLDLSGKTRVGGFYVVGGDVVYDATLSGNVAVSGAIYTLGGFTVNGGGNVLNIDGGVWSGNFTTLNGNAKIAYNESYMNAIKNLELDTDVQIVLWRDLQNPYTVSE